MSSLGEKITSLRDAKGMNQSQLADKTKIPQATISRIESGEIREPKATLLSRIAKSLGTSVDYLVGGAQLTFEELLQTDPRAQEVHRIYCNLDESGREEFEKLARYVEARYREKKGKKAKSK